MEEEREQEESLKNAKKPEREDMGPERERCTYKQSPRAKRQREDMRRRQVLKEAHVKEKTRKEEQEETCSRSGGSTCLLPPPLCLSA